MRLHRGRLFDHVHLRASDLDASKRFYRAAIEACRPGVEINEDQTHLQADELWLDAIGDDDQPSRIHIAFQVEDRATVERFYKAALAAGGRDNGRPGERSYHPGYYAAFVLDPDGNNIEAVYHGTSKRSASSVVIEAG